MSVIENALEDDNEFYKVVEKLCAGYVEKGARANSARLIATDNIRAYIDKRITEKDKSYSLF